jgi:hypothetical protein
MTPQSESALAIQSDCHATHRIRSQRHRLRTCAGYLDSHALATVPDNLERLAGATEVGELTVDLDRIDTRQCRNHCTR